MDLLPEEIDDLHIEAKNLDFTLQHLTERRSLIMRQLNAAKSSTRALPTETLSAIFDYACPTLDTAIIQAAPVSWNNRSHVALKLSHVCSRWRRVAFSTSQLWQSMSILLSAHVDVQRSADILSLHARNVGVLPFSLYFGTAWAVHQLEPIAKVLFQKECSRKIEVLVLKNFWPREWLYHISPDFESLRQLICDDHALRNNKELPEYYQPPLDRIPNISAPNIEEIVLHRTPVTLESSKITVVELQDLDVSICAQILFRCPNLIEFHCVDMSFDSDSQASLTEPQITDLHVRPHLTSFAWQYGWTSWDEAIIKYIRLPALQALFWTSTVTQEEVGELFPPFLIFLFSTREALEVLHLVGETSWSEQNFRQLFAPLTQLLEFGLKFCEAGAPHNLISALTASNVDGDSKLLPSLKDLSIQSCNNGWDDDFAGDLNHLAHEAVQMLQSRLADSQVEFTLTIDQSDWWLDSVQEQVRTMIADGVKLKIFDGKDLVRWLKEDLEA